MSAFRFASPLWLMALVPWLVLVWWSSRRTPRSVLYSSVALLERLPRTWAWRAARASDRLFGAALLLLILALARPQWGLQTYYSHAEGVAIMAAIDRSGSMQALDFQVDGERVDRLAAVKHVFARFVAGDAYLAGRPQDLIGLVTFGGYAEARVPLTLDHRALLTELQRVEVAQPVYDEQGQVVNARFLQDEQATAIGDALALSVERLRQSSAKSKLAIVLSDGENTAGAVTPEDAAALAARFGIKVYAIGIGSTGRAPFPLQEPGAPDRYAMRVVRLDEAALRHLAEVTGGKYFHARDTDALSKIYQEIDQLEKSSSQGAAYIQYREAFLWFLSPAVCWLLIDAVLRSTRLRHWP